MGNVFGFTEEDVRRLSRMLRSFEQSERTSTSRTPRKPPLPIIERKFARAPGGIAGFASVTAETMEFGTCNIYDVDSNGLWTESSPLRTEDVFNPSTNAVEAGANLVIERVASGDATLWLPIFEDCG